MKILILGITLLFNASNSFAGYELTDKSPVVRDTVFTGFGHAMGDILGHTYALLTSRSIAKKAMMSQCKEVFTFGLVRCKTHLKVETFIANSSSERECGGSITPECVFANASYVGEISGKDRVINILLTKEISEIKFGACKLVERYGSYNITALRLVTRVFGAVVNPKIDVKALKLTSFDKVLDDSKFMDQKSQEVGASISIAKVQGHSNEQICDILKEKTLNYASNPESHLDYDFNNTDNYRMVKYK
jgi:hypothetical protein